MKTQRTPLAQWLRNAIATLIRYERWKHRNPLQHAQLTAHNLPMRNMGLFVIVLVIFASCAPKQKIATTTNTERTEQTQVRTTEQTTTNTQATSNTSHERTMLDIESLTDEWEIRHRTFDPTLPADSITGTPPLVSETIINRKKQQGKAATVADVSNVVATNNIAEEVKREGEYKASVSEVGKVVERTSTPANNIHITIIVMLLLISGAAGIFLYLRSRFNSNFK